MNEGSIIAMLVSLMIVVGIILSNQKKNRKEYDERQELVRGRGFKYGFYTLMLYCVFYMMADIVEFKIIMDTFAVMTLGICISLLVHTSYCIWNDGFVALNDEGARGIKSTLLVGVLNFSLGIFNIIDGGVVCDGVITYRCSNLEVGILFLLVVAVMLLKRNRDRKEEEQNK
jgi:hypothetical protein